MIVEEAAAVGDHQTSSDSSDSNFNKGVIGRPFSNSFQMVFSMPGDQSVKVVEQEIKVALIV